MAHLPRSLILALCESFDCVGPARLPTALHRLINRRDAHAVGEAVPDQHPTDIGDSSFPHFFVGAGGL
jgi:hypothetical protein